MDELRTYADRRLELGDMIRAALHVARASGDKQAENRARELLSRLAADTFQLAVAGQFSRGKTTLMNALLGGPYLPMGALPMTSVITRVRYGSHPKAIVRRRTSGLGAEVPLAQVAGYITQASTTRAEQQVVSVEVQVPAEILRLGFEFIDTPGIGSAIEINTATTLRFLPQADAVIFVTGFDSPLTQAEAGFLAGAARHAGKLFLVLNKRDLVSGQDADAAVTFVRNRLRENTSRAGPRIFTLSALQALEAAVHGDDELLSGSGLPELHAELREFLTTGKTQLFLRNIAGDTARLAAGQQRSLRLGRLALDGHPGPEAVLGAFDTLMAGLDRQRAVIAGAIADRIEAGLPGMLAARSHHWPAGLLKLIGPLAQDAVPAGPADGRARDLLDKARERLERASREVISGWLERRAGEVLEMLTAMTAGEVGSLLELARSPGVAGAEIAGLAGDDDRPELAGWSAEDLPDLAIRPPEWSVEVEPLRRSWRRAGSGDAEVSDRLESGLAAAVSAFTARARAAFADAAREWARRLDEEAALQMRQEADWFRYCLRTAAADADLAAAGNLMTRLAAFHAALEAAEPPPSGAGIMTTGRSPDAAAEGCTVCQQMEQALTSYLFTGQFRLASREDEQERHVLSRGVLPAAHLAVRRRRVPSRHLRRVRETGRLGRPSAEVTYRPRRHCRRPGPRRCRPCRRAGNVPPVHGASRPRARRHNRPGLAGPARGYPAVPAAPRPGPDRGHGSQRSTGTAAHARGQAAARQRGHARVRAQTRGLPQRAGNRRGIRRAPRRAAQARRAARAHPAMDRSGIGRGLLIAAGPLAGHRRERLRHAPDRAQAKAWLKTVIRRLTGMGAVYPAKALAAMPVFPAAERGLRRLRSMISEAGTRRSCCGPR